MTNATDEAIARAAEAIGGADALLILAGAGMGVDSGLPDFRGNDGFWRAYPPLAQLGLSFEAMASPRWFATNPRLAWGFYGHRRNLYRTTTPHDGFAILKRWADTKPLGHFVFTSNVDGQFQRAGFADEHIVECHGSIHHNQCRLQCCEEIWPTHDHADIVVDMETLLAEELLPMCSACGHIARPNIAMFGDWAWHVFRAHKQERRLSVVENEWRDRNAKIAVVECGAGRAIATVQRYADRLAEQSNVTLIRINPRDADVPKPERHIALPVGAKAALQQIEALL